MPENIKLDDLGTVIFSKFKHKSEITIYLGSNAATPTSSIISLSEAIRQSKSKIPFVRIIHILMQGPLPYTGEDFQDKVMTFSLFSGPDIRREANLGRVFYLPCSLANIPGMIGKGRRFQPDVVIAKIARNDYTGEYSLGLSLEAIYTAIEAGGIFIGELDSTMPFTYGQSVISEQQLDYIIEDGEIKPIYDFLTPDFDSLNPVERKIGKLISEYFIEDGTTLQVGIGKIPDAVVATIKQSNFKDLGIQTELYGDGLMHLQKAGIVNNRKKKLDPEYSTTSLIMGSKELYEFVNLRAGIQMRSCDYTNCAENIRKNSPFTSINTAMGIDLFGNVWVDFVDAQHYYSGVGGQPDFIRALNDSCFGTPIIAMTSTTSKGKSKIVKEHPPGIDLTASAYDGIVLVNEFGIADLRSLTMGERALAIAHISHPEFREELIKYVYETPRFTKPHLWNRFKTPPGVIYSD